MKIDLSDVKIERLSTNHKIQNFSSYESDLASFLREDALDNMNKQISVTYVWLINEEVVGFITLLTDRIKLKSELKQYFQTKGIMYESLPALKIGRLCVDDKYLRKGIGTMMIEFSIKRARDIFKRYAGCRFITLDAKRNLKRDSIYFYKKRGFKELIELNKKATSMYFDLLDNVEFH